MVRDGNFSWYHPYYAKASLYPFNAGVTSEHTTIFRTAVCNFHCKKDCFHKSYLKRSHLFRFSLKSCIFVYYFFLYHFSFLFYCIKNYNDTLIYCQGAFSSILSMVLAIFFIPCSNSLCFTLQKQTLILSCSFCPI